MRSDADTEKVNKSIRESSRIYSLVGIHSGLKNIILVINWNNTKSYWQIIMCW